MKLYKLYIILLIALIGLSSCNPNTPEMKRQTVFLFMPYSPSLTPYFQQNIRDLEQTILERGLQNERVVVYYGDSETHAELYEIRIRRKECQHNILQEYNDTQINDIQFLTDLFMNVQTHTPAEHYGMVIGGHGTAWLPEGVNFKSRSAAPKDRPLTRWVGGLQQTNISSFVEALQRADLHLDYILFDNCFMSSIEVMYELQEVVDYVIACPTEIMAAGMPYASMGQYLFGTPDYEAICREFYNYYANAKYYPYGTLAVTDCKQVQTLTKTVREIVQQTDIQIVSTDSLQYYDGFNTHLFYDLQDYVTAICGDENLLQKFNEQLARAVPYRVHTEWFYSEISGIEKINSFSGLSTSAPSKNNIAKDYWGSTKWAEEISR